MDELPCAIVLGIAPGILEETLFRGILIGKLRESGKGMMTTLVVSSLMFGLMHIINNIDGVLSQVLYSVVAGMVFGAVYLVSRDIVSVVIFHSATDICQRLYKAADGETTVDMFLTFLAILAIEAVWAVWLVRRAEKKEKSANQAIVAENKTGTP